VNYIDFTLIRLADALLRASLFDGDALEAMASAAYGQDAAALEGPFQPLFHDVTIGVSIPQRATVDASWNSAGVHGEARFIVAGLGRDSSIRVDAFWRGGIIARVTPATGRIIEEVSSWPDPAGLDDEIIADLGALPADAVALENERRTRFLARIRATLHQPDAFTDAIFDDWLQRVGAASVGDLMTRFRGVISTGTLKLRYSDPAAPAPSPRELPLTAAVLIRDAPISLADVMVQSKTVIEHLREAGLERARDSEMGARARMLAVWIVPEAVFDDDDWPGATSGTPAAKRLLRRRAAAKWLGPEGIAFAATPPHQ
jgi:hypothetical protein